MCPLFRGSTAFPSFPHTVSERQTSAENRLTVTTTIEDRTHSEAGAGENGVHPVITRDNEQTRPLNSQSEHREEENGGAGEGDPREGETPPIKEEVEGERAGGVGERVGENGIEEVFRGTTTETVSWL